MTTCVARDGAYPRHLINFGGALYFLGTEGDYNFSLWRSDGTIAGTGPVFTDLPEDGMNFKDLVQAGDRLFFTVDGYGMFVSDGTKAGTSQISERIDDLSPDMDSSSIISAVVNGSLFFTGNEGSGIELFRTTTTPLLPTEPHLLLDIDPRSDGASPFGFVSVGGFTYFTASNDLGRGIWRTDGTAVGTESVKQFGEDRIFSIGEYESVNEALFFTVYDEMHGMELWKSDGTSANTNLVKNIRLDDATEVVGSDPSLLTNMNGTLFFVADDGLHGRELWKSDGTEAGTVLVADINVGSNNGSPHWLTAVNYRVFFLANDGVHGDTLWVSDGTAGGTRRVNDQLSTGYYPPANLTNVNGTLFFTRDRANSPVGTELWKSDGTDDGTVMVRNDFTGDLSELTALNGQLLFLVQVGYDRELWKSDGTAEGMVALAAGQFEFPARLTNLGGAVYFQARTEETGEELWKTDGTEAGTMLFVDAVPGELGSYPFSNVVRFDGAIYFTSSNRLWRTDGTSEGTEVRDIITEDQLWSLTASEDALFFTAETEAFGHEVWVVNATDTVNPTVRSIRQDGEGQSESGSVQWEVVFTEPVRGVHLDDFQLVANGLSGTAITSFVGSGTTYFVTATTGVGTGTLGLRLVDNDSIHDASQNPLGGDGITDLGDGSFMGEVFNFDFAPPTVMSMTRTGTSRTNSNSVGWTLVLSESVTGVDVTDFILTPTGVAGASITSVIGDGTTYTIMANSGSGDGTLGIKLTDNDSISDAAGNVLKGAGTTGANNGSFIGQTYTLDKTAPSTVSFVRQAPVGSLTNADSLVFRVRFSEAMSDVDAADFVVNGSTTGRVTNVSPVSGANGKQFDVTVSGGDLASFSGSVGLNFSTSANIADLAGNVVAKTEPTIDEAYVLDNVVPVVASFDRVAGARNNLNSVSWTVVLSESVTGVDPTDFSLVATGVTGATITSVTGSGATYVVTANSGLGDGTLGIKLVDDDSIHDAVGNPLGGQGLTGTNNGGFLGKVYTFDKTRPNALSFAIQTPATNRTNADTLVFRTKFSETVSNVDRSDFVINGTTTATVTNVVEVSGSSGKQFDVTVSGGNLANFNGVVGLNLSGSPSINDAVGNLVMTSEPVVDDSYLLDNVAPTATSFVRLTPTETPTAANTFVFRATFSRAVVNVDSTDFVVTGGSTATVASVTTVIGSRATQFDITVSGGNVASFNGQIGLNLSSLQNISDQVGNPLPNAEPTIDESFTRLMLRDVTFTATGNAVLKADVVSGLLRVTINNVVDTQLNGVDLALVRSLTINGGTGNDSINLTGLLTGSYSRLTSVSLNGGDGNDTIIGSSLNEIISGGKGNDSLNGGTGTDRLVESASASFTLTNGKLTGNGTDSLANFEEASLTGGASADTLNASAFTGNVTLTGGEGNDTLLGGSGNDSLDGGANNDVLTGNGGNDVLVGGAGGDMVISAGGTNYVATNISLIGNGTDVLDHVEVLSLTTANTSSRIDVSAFVGTAANTLTGGNGDDTIIGSRGRDSITGGAGNDNLKGDDGNDTLMAGAGNDLVDGGAGNDSITGLTGADTLSGGVGDDSIDGGVGNDAILGQDGNDLLVGGDGNDTIIGGIGNDTLKGGKNDDLLIGGFGDDSIDGEAGNDRAVGGQGKSGAPRNGNSQKDAGDSLTAEITDELFATLFAFE